MEFNPTSVHSQQSPSRITPSNSLQNNRMMSNTSASNISGQLRSTTSQAGSGDRQYESVSLSLSSSLGNTPQHTSGPPSFDNPDPKVGMLDQGMAGGAQAEPRASGRYPPAGEESKNSTTTVNTNSCSSQPNIYPLKSKD